MFGKTFAAGAGLAAAAMLALGGSAAFAATPHAVSQHIYYTNASVDAVAGYFATSDDGAYMTHIQGYLGSNGTDSLQQLKPGYTDGQTLSLCDTFTGDALNVGQVLNNNGTKSVGWHVGSYGSDATNNSQGDPCEDGELNGGLGIFPQLQNVPLTDTIVAQILQYDVKGGLCKKGYVDFQAEDITSDPGIWYSSGCQKAPKSGQYNEASAFFTKDSTNVSAPADNYLGTFAHLSLVDSNGVDGSLQATSNWTAYGVDATANGQPSDPNLLQVQANGVPDSFFEDHFDVYAGSPTG